MTVTNLKRTRKLFFFTVALWATWQIGSALQEYKSSQPTKIKETTQLLSNTENKVRTATQKSFEQGIEDARFLLEHTPLEEAWLYDKEHEQWFEDGVGEFQFQNMSMIFTPIENIASLAYFSNKISGVHYHPHSKFFEDYRDTTNWIDSTSIVNKIQEAKNVKMYLSPQPYYQVLTDNERILGLFPDIPHAAPSIADLTTMIFRRYFTKRINEDIELESIICSEHGLTYYDVTDLGLQRYKSGDAPNLFARNVPMYFFYEDGNRKLQDPYITIEFIPFADSLTNSIDRVVTYEQYKKQRRKKKLGF